MGILQRVVNLTKAAANDVLDRLENPLMMLNHYLRDLDNDIAAAEQRHVRQQAQERLLRAKLDELTGQAKHYEQKAAQAVFQDREAEARAALEAALLYEEQAADTARLLQLAVSAAAELEEHVAALKEEKTKLQAKREELTSRIHKAQPGASVPSGAANSSATQGFERIEHKIMEWEAQQELARNPYGRLDPEASKREQEQRNARVEEQLQRLLQKKSDSAQ